MTLSFISIITLDSNVNATGTHIHILTISPEALQ
jgi:hypothetical protein